MLRIVSELESVGDANYNLSRYIRHKHDAKIKYNEYQDENVEKMMSLVNEAENRMVVALDEVQITEEAFKCMSELENEINALRDELKNQNMQHITEHEYDYSTGVNYMDIVIELEKMGDYIINVDEAIYEHKHDK